MKKIILCFITTVYFTGCSNNNETYQDKIDRYELNLANEQAEQGTKNALELSKNNTGLDVKLIVFSDYPIPEYYQQRHLELESPQPEQNLLPSMPPIPTHDH